MKFVISARLLTLACCSVLLPQSAFANDVTTHAFDSGMKACIAWGERADTSNLEDNWILLERRERFNRRGTLQYGSFRYVHPHASISVWIENFATREGKRCAVMPARTSKLRRSPRKGEDRQNGIRLSSEEMRPILSKWAATEASKLGYVDWPQGRELAHSTNRDIQPADIVASLRHCTPEFSAKMDITESLNPRRKIRNWFVSYSSSPAGKDRYVCKSE